MNIKFILVGLSILSICTSISLNDDIFFHKINGYDETNNNFGQTILTKTTETDQDVIIMDNSKVSYFRNPIMYSQYLDRIRSFTKEDADDIKLTCGRGKMADFWKFAGYKVGIVGQEGDDQTITLADNGGSCFEYVNLQYRKLSEDSVQVIFEAGKKQKRFCLDTYVLATTLNIHVATLNRKHHKITFKHLGSSEMENIKKFGIHIFRTCDRFANILPDLFMTVSLFMGGFGTNPYIPFFGSHPTWLEQQLNINFIKQGTGYQWEKRKDIFVDLDDTQVKSGDFIIITRFDGLDQIIEWGTGSRVGHSAVLLEFDGEMYVVESQDGWYWPKKNIQKNTFKQWKKYAKNAGFNVAILPLSSEAYNRFDKEAAVQFFKNLEGVPYGYHNFIFGWIDVPSQNLPPVTTIDFIYVLFSWIEGIYAAPIQSIMGEGLNKRLNTTGLSLAQIADVIYDRNMSLDELFAIVEQDGWIYSDGPSYVCSAFVAGVYKAGGLFGDKTVQATEFTPRDVYQLNFFDKNFKRPQECINADPDLPYCQIMGKFKMNIVDDGYCTIEPYNNMWEHCPSEPPSYSRPAGC